ncbi:protein PXR1 [Emergomyces africanus]|uniref:Protein PXR1 n=1 Tax=Emergomyces africanus TaxID=1955775 RepID=A0A1B7P343_9EURO|nr:protein PXR1 [Emergomyces africanus]
MGLAGPRKRTKISHDPNNTAWSRSTSGYGHKIMSAHGWTPGSFLGASNAAHADHFTSASAGHIRVILKDDNLGLGAKPRAEDEPTGLDAFQGLLGRLNGKSDAELDKEQKKRDDRRLASFVERRWKTMRFVSGGLLVHEKIQELVETTNVGEVDTQPSQSSQDEGKAEKAAKKGRKEKQRVRSDDTGSNLAEESSKQMKKAKKKPRDDPSSAADTGTLSDDTSVKKKRKKSKKRKQKNLESNVTDTGDDKNQGTQSSTPQEEEKSNSRASNPENIVKVKEHRPMSRQLTRGRYIQQKKLALMDAKSLNEIFMVK